MTKTMTKPELEKRASELVAEIRKGADSYEAAKKAGTPWAEEDRKAWDGACTEYDSVKDQLEEARKADEIQSRINQVTEDEKRSQRNGRPMPGLDDRIPGENRTYGDAGHDRDSARRYAQIEADKRNVMRAWLIHNDAPHLIDEEMRASCERLKAYPSVNQLQCRFSDDVTFGNLQREARSMHPSKIHQLGEQRAMGKTATPGVELVPQSWVNAVELAMIAYGPMLAYVTTLTTGDGQKINYPTGDDTGNEGAVIAENTEITTNADPTMSSITIDAFEYHSKFIKVPYTLSRDSIVNIDMLIATLVGERMGRIYTNHATVGDGSGKIKGIRADAHAGKTTAASAAITGDEIIDLMHSLDPAYRPRAIFMAHDAIIAAVRKLKDTTNQYLWQSNLRDGLPDTLLGQPLISNAYMDSTLATTKISMLYGDFNKYIFRRVGTGTLYRLQERFAEYLQTGYLFHQSADGRLIKANATTACPIKKMTQV